MGVRFAEATMVTVAVGYLLVLMWSISNLTFDVWGVLVIVPPLGVVGVIVLRRLFRDDPPALANIMCLGLVAKLGGTAARYWVGFAAYDGGIDAQRYHDYAAPLAADVWAGVAPISSVIPSGTGTPFTEGVTALLYTISGPSKMGGFVVFSFLGYLGVSFYVKAALTAVPGLAHFRYAALCALAPSLVYWPSSIGKEALMMFSLGVATYGLSLLLGRRSMARGFLLAAVGIGATAFVRPHLAGIWLAGLFPALVVLAVVVLRSGATDGRAKKLDTTLLVGMVAVAAVGLIVVSSAAVRYLAPDDETGTADSLTSIIDETSRRTTQARSSFEPPSIASPAHWPYAAARTLTRPLAIEARGAAQLLTAAEMTLLLGAAVITQRRVRNLPRLVLTNPFVTFALATTFLAGLAYSSFANLGILARQKSLIFPFLLLVVCLPRAERDTSQDRSDDPSADEPSLVPPEVQRTSADTGAWNASRHADHPVWALAEVPVGQDRKVVTPDGAGR